MHFHVKVPENCTKTHIYREAKKKEVTADVFRCSSDCGKIRITFLDCLKKHARYSVMYLVFKNLKIRIENSQHLSK